MALCYEEHRNGVMIRIDARHDETFNTHIENHDTGWLIPSQGVRPMRGFKSKKAALKAGRTFVDEHQPRDHEKHYNGHITLYVQKLYGYECRYQYVVEAPGEFKRDSHPKFTTPEAALKAGRVVVQEMIADTEALLNNHHRRLTSRQRT